MATKKQKASWEKSKKEQETRNEVVELTQSAQIEMLEKMRLDMPKYITQRKEQFVQSLKEYGYLKSDAEDDDMVIVDEKKLDNLELISNTFEPLIRVAGKSPKYTVDNIALAFDYYKYCFVELNKYGIYEPSKEDFCRLLGISTHAFSGLKNGNSLEMREICCQVEDYICSIINQKALQSKVDRVVAIFTQKASFGRRDNDPIQINNYTQNNTTISREDFDKLLKQYSNDLTDIEL
jgi:hypothetical protein